MSILNDILQNVFVELIFDCRQMVTFRKECSIIIDFGQNTDNKWNSEKISTMSDIPTKISTTDMTIFRQNIRFELCFNKISTIADILRKCLMSDNLTKYLQ